MECGGRKNTGIDAAEQFEWLAPMVLWELMEPMVNRKVVRIQGGGAQRIDAGRLFAAVLYILFSGAPWREMPRIFHVSWQTAHRRFIEWSRAGLWSALEQAADGPNGSEELKHWAGLVAVAAMHRSRETAETGRLPYEKPAVRCISGPASLRLQIAGDGQNSFLPQTTKQMADRIFDKGKPSPRLPPNL